jgi:hypothetical protein
LAEIIAVNTSGSNAAATRDAKSARQVLIAALTMLHCVIFSPHQDSHTARRAGSTESGRHGNGGVN